MKTRFTWSTDLDRLDKVKEAASERKLTQSTFIDCAIDYYLTNIDVIEEAERNAKLAAKKQKTILS